MNETTNATMAATGTNGYNLHLDVDDQGNTTVRIRSARTGKPHANVQLDAATAQFLASWWNHDTRVKALPTPTPRDEFRSAVERIGGWDAPAKPKRKHRATDGRSHQPTRT